VFEQFQGIPVHPLLVHAAVVFLPMQAAAAVVYAFFPRFRRYIAWFVAGIAVAAPISAFLAKKSGEALRARLIRNGMKDQGLLARIQQHFDFGTMAFWSSLTLGVLMIVLLALLMSRARRASVDGGGDAGSGLPALVVGVLAALVAAATVYYVVRTGDSGAKIVWTGM
jgi:hypothetical protein